jgi:hypothetical protein
MSLADMVEWCRSLRRTNYDDSEVFEQSEYVNLCLSDRQMRLMAADVCHHYWLRQPVYADYVGNRLAAAAAMADGEKPQGDNGSHWLTANSARQALNGALRLVDRYDSMAQPTAHAFRDIVGRPFVAGEGFLKCRECRGSGVHQGIIIPGWSVCEECSGMGLTRMRWDDVRTWMTPDAQHLAEDIYQRRAFDELPYLADALVDAGCELPGLLDHLRSPEPHVLGCWASDLCAGWSD